MQTIKSYKLLIIVLVVEIVGVKAGVGLWVRVIANEFYVLFLWLVKFRLSAKS